MVVTLGGMTTVPRFMPPNAPSPMVTSDVGRLVEVIPDPCNASAPMVVIVSGSTIERRLLSYLNAEIPSTCKRSGNVTDVRLDIARKAFLGISVTLEFGEKVMLTMSLPLRDAPKVVTELGIVNEAICPV